MRSSKLLIYGVLLGAVIWSNSVTADFLLDQADGWHSWQVDEPGTRQVVVRLDGGVPGDIRVSALKIRRCVRVSGRTAVQ